MIYCRFLSLVLSFPFPLPPFSFPLSSFPSPLHPPLSLSPSALSSLPLSSTLSPSPFLLSPSPSSLYLQYPTTSAVMDVVDPIDYEKFLAENATILDSDPQRDLLLFPNDDISVTSLPRKHRTLEIPVPGPAR